MENLIAFLVFIGFMILRSQGRKRARRTEPVKRQENIDNQQLPEEEPVAWDSLEDFWAELTQEPEEETGMEPVGPPAKEPQEEFSRPGSGRIFQGENSMAPGYQATGEGSFRKKEKEEESLVSVTVKKKALWDLGSTTELKRGIILAEILGPPVSKKNRSKGY